MGARWTEQELTFLLDNCGVMSNKHIAEKLGRSPKAIRQKLSKNHISVFSNFYTARLLAKVLGKCHNTIMNWYRAGYLKGKWAEFGRGYLQTPMVFQEKNIIEFLKGHYHLVKCEEIDHPYFKNIVKNYYLTGGKG